MVLTSGLKSEQGPLSWLEREPRQGKHIQGMYCMQQNTNIACMRLKTQYHVQIETALVRSAVLMNPCNLKAARKGV